ncbi:unnamed protein product [Merluccius merluccius]
MKSLFGAAVQAFFFICFSSLSWEKQEKFHGDASPSIDGRLHPIPTPKTRAAWGREPAVRPQREGKHCPADYHRTLTLPLVSRAKAFLST